MRFKIPVYGTRWGQVWSIHDERWLRVVVCGGSQAVIRPVTVDDLHFYRRGEISPKLKGNLIC